MLVAFSILALSLGALLQVFSTGLRSAALSQEYSWATLLAESKLAAMSVSEPLQVGEQSGELDEGFHWRASIEPVQPGEAAPSDVARLGLYEVTVEVFWTHALRERSVTLTTLRLAPQE